MNDYILTLSCPDKIGLVSTVSTWLFNHDCNIIESDQYGDTPSNRFFMRIHFVGQQELHELDESFQGIANSHEMDFQIWPMKRKLRVLVLVSKFDHCLIDLIYRAKTGELPIEIVKVISNHDTVRPIVDSEAIPFEHLEVSAKTKPEQEARISDCIKELEVDLTVLARYMQILSADFCSAHEGRIINIHHSFLPGFKGAKPYQQAFDHGVKLIGATAHYVTADLDEGPIIDQDVERVDHRMSVTELAQVGRDIERIVLARAVRSHAEHRALINGHRTVVFQ
ncbi:MAG: formyltetrahydrofolate deformylase [Pseudomonadales bacterium]|nr:formyltetrahydrofolate deformylase [Pseudomonadales bacterium]